MKVKSKKAKRKIAAAEKEEQRRAKVAEAIIDVGRLVGDLPDEPY